VEPAMRLDIFTYPAMPLYVPGHAATPTNVVERLTCSGSLSFANRRHWRDSSLP